MSNDELRELEFRLLDLEIEQLKKRFPPRRNTETTCKSSCSFIGVIPGEWGDDWMAADYGNPNFSPGKYHRRCPTCKKRFGLRV